MVIVHPVVVDAALHLWGEDASRPGRTLDGRELQTLIAAWASPRLPNVELATLELELPCTEDGIVLWADAPPLSHALSTCTIDVEAVRVDPGDASTLATRIRMMRPSRCWDSLVLVVRHAAALVVRQEVVPTIARSSRHGEVGYDARWRPVPRPSQRAQLDEVFRGIAGSLTCARLRGAQATAPRIELERFVASLVDSQIRRRLHEAPPTPELVLDVRSNLHDRWLAGLIAPDARIAGPVDALDRLASHVEAWHKRVRLVEESPFRLVLRLEEPDDPTGEEDGSDVWFLRFLVESRSDPSIVIDYADAWTPRGSDARALERHGFEPGMHLLAPLLEVAQVCPGIAESLLGPRPVGCELDTAGAHELLADRVDELERLGVGVRIPAWWRGRAGRWRLTLRAHVRDVFAGGNRATESLNLASLVSYDWRVALGDVELTRTELAQLATQKTPLVRIRGRWVELDARERAAALAHLHQHADDPTTPSRPGTQVATMGELLRMSVGGGSAGGPARQLPVSGIDAGPDIEELLGQLAAHDASSPVAVPAGLRATLRPYQERGMSWLVTMAQLGLGACLADDMGLGKTVQALAAILHTWETDDSQGQAQLPSLIVAPTSVLTNWERECERFVPELPVLVHHGPDRASKGELQATVADGVGVVLTSYAVLARDAQEFASVTWGCVVLDEAQNIKNPRTKHSRAARTLVARSRVALTGTPIENNVGDLWSIMEFLNPGLLGTAIDFRRTFLLPIQTESLPDAADRLRSIVGPFILRREKTDRSVIDDLPDKFEMVEHCAMTLEQVGLYEAIVRDAERILRGFAQKGVERRGLILATLTRLKQVCNHPAHLLADNSEIAGRSGKLERLEELLEQVLAQGERALVFTQFVAMGELLQARLQATFGREVLFLHGGISRGRRDALVQRFQDPDASAPPILVLSLKAGGSGLNLTAATHVFHFDRWWNPATERQASDRAFRIGQTRNVQVHALVCTGTIEERIDRLLERKRELSGAIVGTGERWITELGNDEVLDLLKLREQTVLVEGRLDHTGREWRRASL